MAAARHANVVTVLLCDVNLMLKIGWQMYVLLTCQARIVLCGYSKTQLVTIDANNCV
jgi:hypothetical protein